MCQDDIDSLVQNLSQRTAAVEAAVASARALYPRLLAVENRLGYSSGRLAWSARALLRLAAERERRRV